MKPHILKQFDGLNLIETKDIHYADYIFINSINKNFDNWIKIGKLYQVFRTPSLFRQIHPNGKPYIIDEHLHTNYGFDEICEFKMYRIKNN